MNKTIDDILTDVSARYGAPMGRSNVIPDEDETVFWPVMVEQIKFVDGDYDKGGAYWGGGPHVQPIFVAWADTEDAEPGYVEFFRAGSLKDAKALVRERYPTALFGKNLFRGDYIRDYVIAALWSSTDVVKEEDGETGEMVDVDINLDDRCSPEDVCPGTLQGMRNDIAKFLWKTRKLIRVARAVGKDSMEPEQIAHDLWLSSNGHGICFRDRGYERFRRALDDVARRLLPGRDLYIGDSGMVYG